MLLAAALLPWASRAGLGIALIILGIGIHGQRWTGFGARLGPSLVGAVTAILSLGGALLAVSAVVSWLDRDGEAWVTQMTPVVVSLGLLAGLAVAGGATLGRDRSLGLVTATIAGSLAGAVAVAGLLDTASGRVGAVLLIVAIVALAIARDPRVTVRPERARVALLVAAVLATLVSNGLVLVLPPVAELLPVDVIIGYDRTGPVGWALLLVGSTLVGAVVLLLAVLRRDPVAGVLAGVTLLGGSAYVTGGARAIVVALPLAVLLVALAAVARPGVRTALLRIVPAERRAAVDADALGAVVAITLGWLALHASELVAGPQRLIGAITLLLVVLTVVLAHRLDGDAARAAAIVAAVVLLQVAPWWRLIGGEATGGDWSTAVLTAASVATVATALVVGALLLRPGRPAGPAVVAAVTWLIAGTLSTIAVAVLGDQLVGGLDATAGPLALVGIPAVGLVIVAAAALLGPPRRTAELQAAGAVLAFVAAVAVEDYAAFTGLDGQGNGARLVGVLAAVLLLLGLALLAGSTARRRSVAVVLGGGLGVAGAAVLFGAAAAPLDAPQQGITRIGDVLFGAALRDSPLADASPVLPLLVGVLGAALLLVALALEHTRPLPAGARLGGR